MQPTLCSRCHKNVAVIFVTRIDGSETKNEGLCLKCAKELGIKPVQDMMQKMGITDDDLEGITNEMMSAFGGAEGMEGLMAQEDGGDDDEDDEGRTATFPFLNKLFGNGGGESAAPTPSEQPRQSRDEKPGKTEPRQPKRKFLENYCISLTQKALDGKLDRIIGRDQELERVVQILNRRQKNNPCLIGEPGVGKTAIAEGLAMRIAQRDVPYKLMDKEVYLLDLTALVAGTQFRGQFESRMKGLIEEIKKLGNIILVIDEVHNLVGAGDAEGSMNAANILKPALSRGEIQVIGATTLTEYRKYIEKDSALERRFQPVIVEEPSIEDAVQIIQGIAPYYEAYHHVKIAPEMCRLAVTMSERYITDRFLPDKAIDLIDEASSDVNLHNKALARTMEIDKELADIAKEREVMLAAANDKSGEAFQKLKQREAALLQQKERLEAMPAAEGEDPGVRQGRIADLQRQLTGVAQERAVLENQASEKAYQRLAVLKSQELQLTGERDGLTAKGDPALTVEHLARVIELWTKIPASQIQEQEYERLAHLEERLKSHIIGQDEAVKAVASAIRRGRVGIASKRKPVSFIFVGSTGVGKTELVKQLANQLFDGPDPLIRLDMSEYMEKYAVSRMIGSPPGYVGYEEAGQLTEKVRRRPYSVVLFDEIEKAHPDVMNILLQILDEGKINDAQGRTVDFSNTVICMTSNAGSSDKTTSGLGFNKSEEQLSEEKTRKALSQFLRPEFLGRVDEVIAFKPLSQQTLEGIAALMLDEYKPSMEAKDIAYSYTPAALSALVAKSQGGKFGARDLRRVIRKAVEDPAAERIIDGTLKAGSSLTVDAENGEVILK